MFGRSVERLDKLGIDGLWAEFQGSKKVFQLPEIKYVFRHIFTAFLLSNEHISATKSCYNISSADEVAVS